MLNIGVLVSGNGTNLQAIINNIYNGYLARCMIVTVVSSNQDAFALQIAKENNIFHATISKKGCKTIKEYDKKLIANFKMQKVDLVVMAGFNSIVGKDFIQEFKNKIINIHPSLIPSFCGKSLYGMKPHQAALNYGVKVTGATVHFVDEGVDTGPIILQKAVKIKDNDTAEILQQRVMKKAEWKILSKAIKLFEENRLVIENNKVKIL